MRAHLLPILWAVLVCSAQHITGLDDVLKPSHAAPVECAPRTVLP